MRLLRRRSFRDQLPNLQWTTSMKPMESNRIRLQRPVKMLKFFLATALLSLLALSLAQTARAQCAYDTTFLPSGGGANSTVRAVAVQSDGKILIGGDFTYVDRKSTRLN